MDDTAGPMRGTRPGRSRTGNVRRYGFACLSCKARKSKCSGEQPVCGACRKSNTTCTWSAPAAGRQLQHAEDRIQQLEQELRQTRAATREQVQTSSPTISTRTDGCRHHGPNGLSPLTPESPAVLTNIYSHVGRGDDGAVVYNGPTSRFHAGPLDEGAIYEEALSDVATPSFASVAERRRKSHIETLKLQYGLLSNGCIASVHFTMHYDRLRLNHDTCTRLLDIYWTWLQPLHNCVYRPGE